MISVLIDWGECCVIIAKTEIIKAKMFLNGWMISDFAKEVAVSSNHLSNVINNKTSISPRLAKKMAIALDVKIADLFEVHIEKEKDVYDNKT